MCNIDWNQLREQYFQECIDIMPDNTVKINLTAHNLFEWFKSHIEANTPRVGRGQATLFGEMDDKEVEFWNSPVYDQDLWKAKFIEQIHTGIDIMFYYHAVNDWASQLPKRDKRRKKSTRGWVAVGRNFMRSDKERGKLKMLNVENQANTEKMIKFLAESE